MREFAVSHPESNPSDLVGLEQHMPHIWSHFAKSLIVQYIAPLSSALPTESSSTPPIPLQIAAPFLHLTNFPDRISWPRLHIHNQSAWATIVPTPATQQIVSTTAVSTTSSIGPTMMHRLCVGSLHWNQITDIKTCVPIDLTVSGIGFWKKESFGIGGVVRVGPTGCLVLQRESGSGQDISEVSGGIF